MVGLDLFATEALVLPLGDPRSEDGARAGMKASRLALLLHAGFPVPDGFVCTIEAGRRFYHDNALGWDSPAIQYCAN